MAALSAASDRVPVGPGPAVPFEKDAIILSQLAAGHSMREIAMLARLDIDTVRQRVESYKRTWEADRAKVLSATHPASVRQPERPDTTGVEPGVRG